MKKSILENIGKVYEQAKDCKLENAFFETINEELKVLAKYFKTSENQAFFIAMVFALNYNDDSVSLKDLCQYFNCNPMKLLSYNGDLEDLCSKGILQKRKLRSYSKNEGANYQFSTHEKLSEAILKSLPLPIIDKKKIVDIVGLLEELYNLGTQRDENIITTFELFQEAKSNISSCTHFTLIEKIQQFDFPINDTILYLYLVWKNLLGISYVDLGRALEGIFDEPSERIKIIQNMLKGEHILIKNKLIEIEESSYISDIGFKLTDTSRQLLSNCGIELFLHKEKKDNIIIPTDIIKRELIFDPLEMKQLQNLKSLLFEVNFNRTLQKLTEKGLPKGITALFHGAPGTGKTEIVKQLAKETNRNIMKVDISQTKSMLFGESEKKIKQIFTDYKSYTKDCEITPILFFNEADAIISKRKEIGNSNTGQTENAIQNIILEELENFEGIFIATTNLVGNLDSAFDRRFLFKIPFQKPTLSIREKIWKLKFPHLDEEACRLLADKFDFSGGQIDNIVRKKEIQEIIHGTTNLDNILSFCTEELIGTKINRIGFGLRHEMT